MEVRAKKNPVGSPHSLVILFSEKSCYIVISQVCCILAMYREISV